MGRRILSLGVAATHARITSLATFGDPVSVSNYDALVYDPYFFRGMSTIIDTATFVRRKGEVRDLVLRKGGLVLCVLRPQVMVQTSTSGMLHALDLLGLADGRRVDFVKSTLRLGTATRWDLSTGAKGVTSGFVRALASGLRPEAFLEVEASALRQDEITLVAADSAAWPVSIELACGPGRLSFVPVPVDVKDGQLGAAVARMVEDHFGGSVEVELPEWVGGVSVPGSGANDARIAKLEKEREEVAAELARLSEEKSRLLNFRVLLFGYGKSLLEPVVRRSLRELGFKVLEPEEYDGEWDVDLTDDETGASAVGEVEGSEGAINVGKLRQLLNYVEAEEDAGRKRKGILVGNGYRLKDLNEPERGEQFTEKVLKEANGFEYCLLPTSDLFAAVCAVLERSGDEALKKHLRRSILSAVGVWRFGGLSQAVTAGEGKQEPGSGGEKK